MTRKLFFCFKLLLSTIFSYPQSQVSITAGIHKAWVTPNFLRYPDSSINTKKSTTGIEFGFSAYIPINEKIYFRPGIIYSVKGSNWNQIYDTANLIANTKQLPQKDRIKSLSLDTKLSVTYIDMPLNVIFKTKIGAKTKFLIGGGPQLSFLYNGYKKLNEIGVSQDSAAEAILHFKSENNSDLPIGKLTERYRTFHFGANGLAGFDFGRIYFIITYSQDLSEFYEEEGRNYKNKTLGVAMGIYFGQIEKN